MDLAFIIEIFPLIWKGLATTISLFVWSMVWGTLGAIVLALMRFSKFPPLRWFAVAFGWVIRGIPLLILLFYAYFGLPQVGIVLPAFVAGVMGFSIWTAAYQAEVIRSGILAVDPGQYEASEALGVTKRHYMRRIVIPQGIRILVPPYIGNAMTLVKQTSLGIVVTVPELTAMAQRIISSEFRAVEPLFTVALVYLVLTSVLLVPQQILESKFALRV